MSVSRACSRRRAALSLLAWLACGYGCSGNGSGQTPAPQSAAQGAVESRARSATSATAVALPSSAPNAKASTTPQSNATPPPALAPLTPDPVAEVLALDASHSTSIGAPGDGKVEGAVALPDEGPGFRHNPRRPDEARFGTVELVQTIVRAAAIVEHALPGSELVVNDLGLEHGGPIAQHGSHEAGRDADILFYALDRDGKPMPAVGVPIEPNGTGVDYKDLHDPNDDVLVRLDAPRTWRFAQALIEVAGAQLQRIFLVEHVRAMLLAQAKRAHAPTDVVARFADLSCQPGTPHDDHMHVRLYCAGDDIGHGCLDSPPIYPWHREALSALGFSPVLERARRRTERKDAVEKRTTSRAEAREKAGPMDVEVTRFLDRREHWAKQPHPGRRYCR